VTVNHGSMTKSGSSDDCSRAAYRKWLKWIVLTGIIFRVVILLLAELRPERFRFFRILIDMCWLRATSPRGTGRCRTTRFSGTDPLYPLLLSPAILLGVEDEAAILRFGRLV